MTLRRCLALVSVAAIVLVLSAAVPNQLAAAGAGGLLHPARHRVTMPTPAGCEDTTFTGDGLDLKGWRCHGAVPRRATLVYLHGVADNRSSAAGVINRFGKRGFDVLAYDSRAHGESSGDVCTYGFVEKRDLHRVLVDVDSGPIVLLGTSLGAAVALQEAAQDSRVTFLRSMRGASWSRTIFAARFAQAGSWKLPAGNWKRTRFTP
jgi:uncharacterized protein